jgi:hypothetical protein
MTTAASLIRADTTQAKWKAIAKAVTALINVKPDVWVWRIPCTNQYIKILIAIKV